MRGGLIFFGLLILLALAAIAGLMLRPATVIGVTDKSLAYSLRGVSDSSRTGSCRQLPTKGSDDERYACTVLTGDSDDREYAYLVEVDDYGCWTAKPGDGGMKAGPGSLESCITIVDLVRLGD